MRRVIIICEGPTEREFCNKILAPFFSPMGIYIEAPVIKHSHGGIVPWRYLHRQIDIHLRSDQKAYVTTLIDYYGISDKHEFPCWEEAKKRANAIERVSMIEDGMLASVGDSMRPRFLPYIQLHEFEGRKPHPPTVLNALYKVMTRSYMATILPRALVWLKSVSVAPGSTSGLRIFVN